MILFNKFVKIISILTALMLVCSGVSAEEKYSVPQWLDEYGDRTYSAAREEFGRGSFSGYCGTYVRCQLTVMGIFSGKHDFRGNGNQWYRGFENTERTSGGYNVYRESGGDCIEKLTQKYGNNLRNVLVSFPVQANYSPRNPGAGHAFLIYALIDNVAYYSESFSYGNHAEGKVIAEDVNSLMERYNRKFGAANGCVMFSAEELCKEAECEGTVIASGVLTSDENTSDSLKFLYYIEEITAKRA